MSSKTLAHYESTVQTGGMGISLMLHGIIATSIVICAIFLKTTREEIQRPIIDLVPDGDVTNHSPALPLPPTINPLPVVPAQPTGETASPNPLGRQMTEQEFRSLHGIPGNARPQNQRPHTTSNTTVSHKPIDSPAFHDTSTDSSTIVNSQMETRIQNQMDAYFARLAQHIREAQEKPAGLGSELVVRVEFQVSAKGDIGAVKVIRSSGNRAFDDSVLKAIRSVRSIGDRPDGKSGAKTADFRMREED